MPLAVKTPRPPGALAETRAPRAIFLHSFFVLLPVRLLELAAAVDHSPASFAGPQFSTDARATSVIWHAAQQHLPSHELFCLAFVSTQPAPLNLPTFSFPGAPIIILVLLRCCPRGLLQRLPRRAVHFPTSRFHRRRRSTFAFWAATSASVMNLKSSSSTSKMSVLPPNWPRSP